MSIFNRRKRPVSLTIEEDAVRVVRLKSMDPLVVDVAEEVSLPPNIDRRGKDCRSGNACDDFGRGREAMGYLQKIRSISRPGSICHYP